MCYISVKHRLQMKPNMFIRKEQITHFDVNIQCYIGSKSDYNDNGREVKKIGVIS